MGDGRHGVPSLPRLRRSSCPATDFVETLWALWRRHVQLNSQKLRGLPWRHLPKDWLLRDQMLPMVIGLSVEPDVVTDPDYGAHFFPLSRWRRLSLPAREVRVAEVMRSM